VLLLGVLALEGVKPGVARLPAVEAGLFLPFLAALLMFLVISLRRGIVVLPGMPVGVDGDMTM
jgi:hypothetical protein